MSAEAVRPASRRFLWRGLGLVALLAMGLLGLAWGRGWFAPAPREIPGNLTEGDAEVVAAIRKARTAVVKEPKSATAWGKLGQVLQVHNFLDYALAAYAEAARLEPRNPNWPYFRASIFLVRATPADAISELERAAERGGLDELPRLRLGELFIGQGRFDEADEILRKVLEARPNDPRAHLLMAQVAIARQAWAECLRHLETVADAPPAQKQVCALRLLAYGRLGDTAGLKREQGRLAKLPDDPAWPDPLLDDLTRFQVGVLPRLTKALTLLQQGQTQEAVAILHEAVRDYPDSDIAYGALGRCMALRGNYAEAEEALRKSLELAPDSADIWSVLAEVRVKRRDLQGTLKCLREVIRLKPTDAQAHYKVGLIKVETGDRAGAIEAFRQAIRYRPDYREARQELDKLTGSLPNQ